MLLIVFASSPLESLQFEQGLEVALAAADLELEVEVIFEGACAEAVQQASAQDSFVKKLGQLELYAIPVFCDSQLQRFDCQTLDPDRLRQKMNSAHAILVV